MANLFIIMGVSGSGKSTLAEQLADKIGYSFVDADDFHSDNAKEKMAAGEALTDELRSQWMQHLQRFLTIKARQETSVVLAHSGLKKVHRDMLRVLGFKPHFFFLEGSESLIAERMQKRSEHFFPVNLLHSQFQTLEHPKLSQEKGEELDVNIISIEQSINVIVTQVEHAAIKFITSST
ncbi:gluconokinase [Cognaticolwellia mytili]|uniref:gluconokinase n=1 Tax=Cognaticolwellia mytili TaxID=1888913 RepID=UPI000A16E735|nr:gluconokinase, GntK/IdnK-type [Cognaticolwellia mytili]